MLNNLIDWVIKQRWLVLAIAGLLSVGGIVSVYHLPFDAFPDTTPVLVTVNTNVSGYAAEDVETQITARIERNLGGLAGLREMRSISKSNLSQITCVFDDQTDIYLARQQISERLTSLDLPEGVEHPELGPVSTGLGEIFHYIVVDTLSGAPKTRAREVQDWLIKPRLQTVPGVVEVNSWGGFEKQFQVIVDPQKLLALNLPLNQVVAALREGQINVGGGVTQRANERFVVQGVGAITNLEDIRDIVVDSRNGIPIHIHDVADVAIGHAIRYASSTFNEHGEAVLGLGFMLTGENPQDVTKALAAALETAKQSLPEGIDAHVVYERTDLVNEVLDTVTHNLLYGALLVIAILFAFLGNFRASLIVALAIPLSMLFAFNLMLQMGIAGSLMSLGAIDFGLAVDNAVIQVENVSRRLSSGLGGRSRFAVIKDAIMEVRKPTLFGELIIMLVYLPILTLEGIEGKMFRPMAMTVILVLTGSLILSFTVIPALSALFMRETAHEEKSKLVEFLTRHYQLVLDWALNRTRTVIAVTCALVIVAGVVLNSRGSEFIPKLSEGSIVINLIRLAGVSLEQSTENAQSVEKIVKEKFPDEVKEVWSRTGTPELATDPMGVELTDVFVTLNPREQWKQARSQAELVTLMDQELSDLPGMNMVFTQPIEMRFNELISGIRTDLGIKIFGDDLEILKTKADEVRQIVEATEGAQDINVEQITGQPVVQLKLDRKALARYSLTSAEVLEAIQAIGGIPAGQVFESQRTFDLDVYIAPEYTQTPEALDKIILPTHGGEFVPLTQVATLTQTDGAATISHEWSKRRIAVQCNIRGRDIGSFVDEVRGRTEKEIQLDPGYYIEFGGQFEHLERARTRLLIVVPLALILIFGLLYWTYKSARDAFLIFTGVPLAAVGGVFALALRGMPFTISAGVGFIALSGIAVLNGLVLVSSIRNLQQEGVNFKDAIRTSGALRMRPVLMTALVAAFGFIPMMISHGVGAEVQRPLATVVVGGIVTSTMLTLIVLPVLYTRFGRPITEKEVV
jgi:cobalt-zinc-cadmium resistance protein CzcA